MPSLTGRRTTAVTALVVVAAVGWWAYGNRHDFFDLKIYVNAVRFWADGHPLYDYAQPDRVQGALYFTYPPFAALLLWPFGQVPLWLTIGLFTLGSAVALGLTTYWLVTPVADRREVPRWFLVGLAVPLVFVIEPNRETVTLGQLNMLLVVLVLGDVLFAVPKKKSWAGALIGLATAIKLVPGIFIVYLLVTRRWRAAAVASGTAAAATLLAAAVTPRDSWQFWTEALWATDRVGRTDYTGNQSLLGLLSRLVAPAEPNRLIWLVLAVAVAGFGLWRAARVSAAGDEVSALTIAGLVGALVSPITWPHHLYWFVPALIVLLDAAFAERAERRRLALFALVFLGYAVSLFGVVSFIDWGVAAVPTDTIWLFLGRNMDVLFALVCIAALPARPPVDTALYHNRRKLDRSISTP